MDKCILEGLLLVQEYKGQLKQEKNNALKIIVLVNSVIIGDVIVMKTDTVV